MTFPSQRSPYRTKTDLPSSKCYSPVLELGNHLWTIYHDRNRVHESYTYTSVARDMGIDRTNEHVHELFHPTFQFFFVQGGQKVRSVSLQLFGRADVVFQA